MPSKDDRRGSGDDSSNTHLLLCKKVAQLTKVIYLLNSKNEDAELRLQELQQRYQEELEKVEADATGKLEALKKANNPADAAIAMTKQLEALEAKYEAEKQSALRQFDEWKGQLAVKTDER
eukprot:125515-Prymnesium_polylepis.1